MEIQVIQRVSYNMIANLLCSAFDPASRSTGYWCEIEGYGKPSMMTFVNNFGVGEEVPYVDYPLNHNGEIRLMDTEDDHEHYLDLEKISHGLQKMALAEPKHFGDLMSGNDDGVTADVFVQCCLFGEVKYS